MMTNNTSQNRQYDFLIVGAGIVGLAVAREILLRRLGSVCVLEKEAELGKHASGRNSGVLHAGFYYTAESLKAKFCAQGARELYEYAQAKKIPVLRNGKVVVPCGPDGVPQLDVLLERGRANGIEIRKIDRQQLREIEPAAVSVDYALYSPNTGVIDSKAILAAFEAEIIARGGKVLRATELRSVDASAGSAMTTQGTVGFGKLINTAGLYADRIAHLFGIGKQYTILPFKGVYWKLTPGAATQFKGSIYPTPDLRMPFLGVHVTKNIRGEVYLGPTAIPAFGRENYGLFQGVSLREAPGIAGRLLKMAAFNVQGVRALMKEELGRYRKSVFLKAAQAVAPGLRSEDLSHDGKVGVRAQLYDRQLGKLEMDFIVTPGERSLHVLNAISPAFTASMPIARYVVDRL